MDEQLDEEPLKGPEDTTTKTTVKSLNNGDQLAVDDDDDHWWQIKTIAVEIKHQDMKAEFLDPNGPTAKVQPLLGTRKDHKDPPNDSYRTHTGQRLEVGDIEESKTKG